MKQPLHPIAPRRVQRAKSARSRNPSIGDPNFENVKIYCMFLCHARSGHSLFGSLLDAHPDIVLAHEFNALKKIQNGASRQQLFAGLWQRSIAFTRIGRRWNGYDYLVPNQWQGRCRKLTVIGDKKGGVSTMLLKKNPQLLQRLREAIGMPIKIFRMIRNPYDNIRTVSRYYFRDQLNPAIEDYFSRCAIIEKFRRNFPAEDWFDIYHEDFVYCPQLILKAACRHLGVRPTESYLEDCASIVFTEPLKRRFEVTWTDAQLRKVEAGTRKYTHLSRYTFDA